MDTSTVIHGRSIRLNDALDALGSGDLTLDEMLQIIDREEKSSDIPNADGFFGAMRELSRKVAAATQSFSHEADDQAR